MQFLLWPSRKKRPAYAKGQNSKTFAFLDGTMFGEENTEGELTDLELAAAVASGDRQALAAFVEAYHPGVFRYMVSLLLRMEDAEDLAMETMLSAQHSVRRYRGDASLKTWVHRIAYHEFTHWQRRQRLWLPLRHDLTKAERTFADIDDAEAVRHALALLPEKLRQPFVLHEINELPLTEVAAVLNVPLGTVKTHTFQARQRLRELLSHPSEVNYVPALES